MELPPIFKACGINVLNGGCINRDPRPLIRKLLGPNIWKHTATTNGYYCDIQNADITIAPSLHPCDSADLAMLDAAWRAYVIMQHHPKNYRHFIIKMPDILDPLTQLYEFFYQYSDWYCYPKYTTVDGICTVRLDAEYLGEDADPKSVAINALEYLRTCLDLVCY